MTHSSNKGRSKVSEHGFQILVASALTSREIQALLVASIPSSAPERSAVVVGAVVIDIGKNPLRDCPPQASDPVPWHRFEYELSGFGLNDSAIKPLRELPQRIVQALEATGARCAVLWEDEADASPAAP